MFDVEHFIRALHRGLGAQDHIDGLRHHFAVFGDGPPELRAMGCCQLRGFLNAKQNPMMMP